MEQILLTDPDVTPTEEVLNEALGQLSPFFGEFMNAVSAEEIKLEPNWRFYKDGKAWLCKMTFKKKTVVWLSVWDHCFKLGFYFTEKTGGGIPDLEIAQALKDFYLNHEPIGKMKPLVIEAISADQLEDILTVIRYKISKL